MGQFRRMSLFTALSSALREFFVLFQDPRKNDAISEGSGSIYRPFQERKSAALSDIIEDLTIKYQDHRPLLVPTSALEREKS
jgi:hypothetical protein